jgi:hypothetical protein
METIFTGIPLCFQVVVAYQRDIYHIVAVSFNA